MNYNIVIFINKIFDDLRIKIYNFPLKIFLFQYFLIHICFIYINEFSAPIYANKLKKSEGRIDWSRASAQIECQIRALNPWPGVWFEFSGHRIKVLAAHVGDEIGPAGTVVNSPLNIACGQGSICIDRLQQAGRDPMDVKEFIRGSPIAVGTLLIFAKQV